MGDEMKKIWGRILGVLFMLLAMGMTVCAVDAGDIKINRVYQVNSDVELHEEPDQASAVTATLPNGTPVIVKEDANEGWCMVAYREQEGYVEISFLAIFGSQSSPVVTDSSAAGGNDVVSNDGTVQNNEVQPDADVAQRKETQPDNETPESGITVTANEKTLDDEFRIIQEENRRAYEEAEAAKRQAKSDRVWRGVIVALVIAIFAVGIVTTLAGNKGKKKEQ